MSRKKHKKRNHTGVPALVAEPSNDAQPKPTGLLDCVDPATGQSDSLPFWLPDDVDVQSLGLTRAVFA